MWVAHTILWPRKLTLQLGLEDPGSRGCAEPVTEGAERISGGKGALLEETQPGLHRDHLSSQLRLNQSICSLNLRMVESAGEPRVRSCSVSSSPASSFPTQAAAIRAGLLGPQSPPRDLALSVTVACTGRQDISSFPIAWSKRHNGSITWLPRQHTHFQKKLFRSPSPLLRGDK